MVPLVEVVVVGNQCDSPLLANKTFSSRQNFASDLTGSPKSFSCTLRRANFKNSRPIWIMRKDWQLKKFRLRICKT